MASVEIDGLSELVTDLGRVESKALPLVDKVLEKAAANVKDEMAQDARGSRWFQFADTISYDSDYRVGQVAYEVGPDRARSPRARIANIAYFGGANGGGGTLDIDKPLRSEEPRMMSALDDALKDVL